MTGVDEKPDDNVLAAEYVLRLMPEDARRAFAERMAVEPDLAALVAAWEEDFAALAETVAEERPPQRIKDRIDERLFPQAAPRKAWWGRGLWAALAVAVALLVVTQPWAPPAPEFTAEIAAEDRGLVLRAAYTDDALIVERLAGDVQAGRAQELWLIAEGGAPVSLGLLEPQGPSRITVPDDLRPVLAGATLAVSDEPPGGSPTGQPTGAVLAAGVFVSG